MKTFNIPSLILAGLLVVAPAAFARGGGGGHGGGGHGGGGHFGSAGRVAAGHHSGWHGGYWHGGHWFAGWPWWLGSSVGIGIDDYGYDYYPDADTVTTQSDSTVVTVQRALRNLGYYHGPIDGVVGPQTVKAIRWFQTVDKLPVTGQIDSQMLKALWIS
jgi:hypothetical protein